MNKIRFRKYLIFPNTQIKYAAIFSSIVLTSLICVSVVLAPFFDNILASKCDPESFSNLKDDFIIFYVSVALISTFLTFIASVLVTHRFLGPFYAVKRSLDFYREKKTFKNIEVRKSDEIRPLINELNKFFQELKINEKT